MSSSSSGFGYLGFLLAFSSITGGGGGVNLVKI